MEVEIEFISRVDSYWNERTIHIKLVPRNDQDEQILKKLSDPCFKLGDTYLELMLDHGEGLVFNRPGCFPIFSRR